MDNESRTGGQGRPRGATRGAGAPAQPRRQDGRQSGGKPMYGKSAPVRDKSGYGRPDGAKPRYGKPDAPRADKPGYGRPDGTKPQYGKPDAPRADKPGYGRPDGAKPRYGKPDVPRADKPGYGRPDGVKPAYGRGSGAAGQSVQARAKGASAARVAALEALLEVGRQGAYSGLALDRVLKKHALGDADRRLCTELFYGCLEKRLYLDYAIHPYLRRPFDDEVMDEILRMAVYQALFLTRIPENAICSEAVELVRLRGREALCPVTNGILRAFLRRESDVPLPQDPQQRLSLDTSTPLWLIQALQAQLGPEQAEAFLRAPQDRSMTVRVNTLNWTAQELSQWLTQNGYSFRQTPLQDAFSVQGGALASSEPFMKGQIAIMGLASMLACRALGVKNGWHVLDACAAPGGKSCYIGQLMSGTGRVTAMDLHPHRVELISAYAKRMRLDNVRPRVADASQMDESLYERMDAVLVDAPCSGLGVLHHKPDIKYTVSSEQLTQLPQTQRAILESAAQAVRPGGVLVYSTCTILEAENAAVVRGFLKDHPEFALEGLEQHLPEPYAGSVRDGMVQLMPQQDGTDGFFIARMCKAGRKR